MTGSRLAIRTILGLCSRDRGHDRMYALLGEHLASYRNHRYSWEALIGQAEYQGVAPLLYKHSQAIDFTLPDGQHRILRSLCQRCHLANQIRNRTVSAVLAAFAEQRITALLIKGIALSNSVYESPGLRPMRDIDLLVKKHALENVCSVLKQEGFTQDVRHDIPVDYYHLPPLHKTVDGLPVTVEVHHELLPPDTSYPLRRHQHFHRAVHRFRIDGVDAATLNPEDNLHYLYLHGLKAPLTYEPYRLVHVADLVSLTELFFERIDWDRVAADFPLCLNILSRLHFVTPWPERIITGLKLDTSKPPHQPGRPYLGWPLIKIKDTTASGLPRLIRETFLPSPWWQQVYYGHIDGPAYYRMRWFEHPRAIWRWVKIYAKARFGNT